MLSTTQKLKVLFVTDDIRFPTGVGTQARKVMLGLNRLGKYDVLQIGCSIISQPPDVITEEGVRIYPTGKAYEDLPLIKSVIHSEKPDIVVLFADPRFFVNLFTIDNEIREMAKLVLWHTWDNEPFPEYNRIWYKCCEGVATFSNFSHRLLNSGKVENTCIPLGLDPNEFYPLPREVVEKERIKVIEAAGLKHIKRLIFWNNRNLHRKRPESVLSAFNKWFNSMNKKRDTALLLNTNSIDPDGNDLLYLINDLYKHKMPIIFNLQRVITEQMNIFYNISDLTINIAYGEGFGLCVGESLLAGTPVLATYTGGMIEQLHNNHEHFGLLIKPSAVNLYGVQETPYIYHDYVSEESVVAGIDKIMNNREKYKLKALKGRQHIIDNFNVIDMVNKWDRFLEQIDQAPSKFESYKIIPINGEKETVLL